MKPLEFLAGVLPPPGQGLYCVAGLSARRKEHVFVESLAEIRPHIKRWVQLKREVYVAMSVFDPVVRTLKKDRRTAVNARWINALFIDMDGYETKKEAALALAAFLEKTGLDKFGQPHIVSSGGGIHCHWPLTEASDIVTWKPIAENFKRLCAQEGLRIDNTVTADAARLMRIPSTFNNKPKYPEPREVKILLEGNAQVDLRAWGATVNGLLLPINTPISNSYTNVTIDLEGKRPTKAQEAKSALAEALMQNASTSFKTIWLKSEQGAGCGQVQHYLRNASQDGMEPLWRGLLSWAKVCEDGTEYSVKLSELHPYSDARMKQKLNEIKGPYPCSKMDSENPGVCPSCPHWGLITNGLALGREVRVDNTPKTFEIPLQMAADEPDDTQYRLNDEISSEDDEASVPVNTRTRKAERPAPPFGFDYGEQPHSGVYTTVREKSGSTWVETQLQVLAQDLFVVDLLRTDDKEHMVHMTAIKAIGAPDTEKKIEYTQIIMPTRAVVSKEELLKSLAANNVYASRGASADAHLARYVRACVEEAALTKEAVPVPTQFGWQRDRSFVYNNRIFRPDGSEVAVPMPGLENLNRDTASKGTLAGWRKPWELLIKREMYTMLAFCVDSFGSSLMHFSDQEGFTWHIGSTGSGTGKSLTLSLKAGVWGHPIRYRTGKGTSPVALQQRAGLLNSMPLLMDELTSRTRNDMEWAPTHIFDISEGKGKERMESGTNKERLNNSTWALTCTMTSNTHMVDVLTGARKHSSHGEMMRMLEWTPTAELKFNDSERQILKELRRNYGVAAEAWIRWLVPHYALAKSVWDKTHAMLRGKFNFTDEERYWHAAVTNDVTAGILLGPNYANLLTIPMEAMIDALHELVTEARSNHRRSARCAEDVLNAYIRDNYGHFVIVRTGVGGVTLNQLGESMAASNSTKSVIMGRIEHGTIKENFVEFYVEEQLLKQFCSAMSFGYADFKRQMELLKKEGYSVVFGTKKNLLANTNGPSLRVNVMHIGIPKEKLDETVGEVPVVKT